jgi:catechol 2,3-dioxygenase-like lactoylglutathione lyase family enzyme
VLANAPLVAFVAAADAAQARAFYADTLGLRLRSDDRFALVFDAHGVTLRVQKVQQVSPPPYTVLGWQVPDLPEAVRQLTARGIRFEHFDGLEQDELGIWTAPGGSGVAWFRDPEGHLLSLND